MWEVFSAGASPYATMGNSQVVNHVSTFFTCGLILFYIFTGRRVACMAFVECVVHFIIC